jgi:hypothetical protein
MAAQVVEDNVRDRCGGSLGIPVGDRIDNALVGGDGDRRSTS